MSADTSYVLVIADANGFERCYWGMTRADADRVASLLPRSDDSAVYVARLIPNAARLADMRAQGEMRGQERWYDAIETLDGKHIRYVGR